MGRRAVGRIQSVLWSRQDRLFLLDTGSPSLHNPSVLAGCQVYHYCRKATGHAPALWSCFAGISRGTSFSSGVANADQSPLTSLLSACLDQDLNMSYLVQPDTGAAVPRGSQRIPPGCGALCPPPDGETSCGAKNEGLFFLAKRGILAHPTDSPAMNPSCCALIHWTVQRGEQDCRKSAACRGTHKHHQPRVCFTSPHWWIYTDEMNPLETPCLWGRLKALAPKWEFLALALIKSCMFLPPRGSHRPRIEGQDVPNLFM